MNEQNCGCKVKAHLSDMKTLTGSIDYCRRHNAVPALVEALKNIAHISGQYAGHVGRPMLDDMFEIKTQAQQALALVEKGEG